MKKLILLIAVIAISLGQLQAQDKYKGSKYSPDEKAKMRAEKMQEKLELTDEQTVKIEALFLSKHAEKMRLKEQHKDSKEAMRTEMKLMREKAEAELRNILTAEQMEKWEAMRAEHKGKGKGHHKSGKHMNK